MSFSSTYPLRQTALQRFRRSQTKSFLRKDLPPSHQDRVARDLRAVGISRYGLSSQEGRYISQVIHADESIGGAVYGYAKDGYAMIVATDSRVVFLDNKPLFVNKDEITYGLVGGISLGKAGPWATVTLHTRLGDFKLRSMNYGSIKRFVGFIEQRCLEHKLHSETYKNDFSPST